MVTDLTAAVLSEAVNELAASFHEVMNADLDRIEDQKLADLSGGLALA